MRSKKKLVADLENDWHSCCPDDPRRRSGISHFKAGCEVKISEGRYNGTPCVLGPACHRKARHAGCEVSSCVRGMGEGRLRGHLKFVLKDDWPITRADPDIQREMS